MCLRQKSKPGVQDAIVTIPRGFIIWGFVQHTRDKLQRRGSKSIKVNQNNKSSNSA